MRADLDADRREQRLADRAARDARRGLARGGALEHVADVREAVLPDPHEIGVTGAREVHLLRLGRDRPGVHALFPVDVVAVRDAQGDRTAERASVTHSRNDFRAVLLDLHAAAAAVAELAPSEVGVDPLAVELEARGNPLEDARETRAMGLSRGCEAQRHAR